MLIPVKRLTGIYLTNDLLNAANNSLNYRFRRIAFGQKRWLAFAPRAIKTNHFPFFIFASGRRPNFAGVSRATIERAAFAAFTVQLGDSFPNCCPEECYFFSAEEIFGSKNPVTKAAL